MAKRNMSGLGRKTTKKAAPKGGAKKSAAKGATSEKKKSAARTPTVAARAKKGAPRKATAVATGVSRGKPAARGKAAKPVRKATRPATVKSGKHTSKKAPRSTGATSAPRGGGSKSERLQRTFAEAVERAMQGYLFDAIALFQDVVRRDRRSDVADDALFNIGACYLQMHLYNDAEKAFTQVLEQYPDATIHAVAGGQEVGRTAAKALLGRYRARRMLKDSAGAAADRDALQGYGDSYVVNPDGQRITFFELAGT